jgi:hypothetical protein
LASACQQCRRAVVSCFIHIALHGGKKKKLETSAEEIHHRFCDEVQLFYFIFPFFFLSYCALLVVPCISPLSFAAERKRKSGTPINQLKSPMNV